MKFYENYYKGIIKTLKDINEEEKVKIDKASNLIFETMKKNGMIYIFGTGHSHLIALEGFYRAGGLGNICPILIDEIMLHNSAAGSSKHEKNSDFINKILNKYQINNNDIVIIFSVSGRNGLPIELAKYLQKNKINLITVSSKVYWDITKDLIYKYGNINIDNHSLFGDVLLYDQKIDTSYMSSSTILNSFILNTLLSKAIKKAIENNVEIYLYKSNNIDGNQKHNKAIIDKFKSKISSL